MPVKQINITFSEEDYQHLETESRQAPWNCTPTEMCRQLVLGRGEKSISVSPDAARATAHYEALISLLKADKADLLDRLAETSRQQGLSGLQTARSDKDEKVEKIIERKQLDWEHKLLKEKHEDLKNQHRLLNETYKELESEVDELRDSVRADARFQGYMAAGGKMLGEVVQGLPPETQERIASGGLRGLLMGTPGVAAGELSGALSEEQERTLRLGAAIEKDFPGEQTAKLVQVLRYFRTYPAILASIRSQQQFQQFITPNPAPQ